MHYSINKNLPGNKIKIYFDNISKYGYYKLNIKNLESYINYLYKGIDFHDKNCLDIGGGFGLYSIFSELLGAKKTIILEPELAGSNNKNKEKFLKLKNELNLKNTYLINKSLQKFNYKSDYFDIILLHNSINHLDESACKKLKFDASAREIYKNILEKIDELSNKNCELIICDCSRYNIFNILGLKNPLAKTIEWEKHQSPKLWERLFNEFGFMNSDIRWLPPKPLRAIGRKLFGNKYISFFLNSYFCIKMKKFTDLRGRKSDIFALR